MSSFNPFEQAAVSSTLSSRMGAPQQQQPPRRQLPSVFIPPTPHANEVSALMDYSAEVRVSAPAPPQNLAPSTAVSRSERPSSQSSSGSKKRREPNSDALAKREVEAAKRQRQEGVVRLLQVYGEDKNVLKKESKFLGGFQFSNTLPDPPVEPKLLNLAVDLEAQASIENFTLPQTKNHSILNDNALGLEINLLDPEQFFIETPTPPMDPKDKALISQVHLLTKKKSGRTRDRSKSSVPWLMTSALLTSNNTHEELYTAEVRRKAQDDEFENPESVLKVKLEDVFRDFAKQFEEANDPNTQYIHPDPSKRGKVTIVSSAPVIPSLTMVGSNLTQASFDNEPMPTDADAATAQEAREKSYVIAVEVEKLVGRGTMNLMTNIVPDKLAKRMLGDNAAATAQEEEDDDLEDLFADEPKQSQATVYSSIRNLGYKFGQETERLVWIEGGSSNVVEFAPIRYRLDLHELVAQNEGADQIEGVSKFTVTQVPMSEEAVHQLQLRQLEMLEGDYEEEDEEDDDDVDEENDGDMDIVIDDQ